MNSNTTIVAEPMGLSKEDLADEYDKLCIAYKNEKQNNESYQQILHKLKLDHQIALNAENFLSTELDAIQSSHTAATNDLTMRYEHDLEQMRKRYTDAMERNLMQEAELTVARDTIDVLRKQQQQMLHQQKTSGLSLDRQTSQSVEFLMDTVDKLEKESFDVKCTESVLREQMNSILIANERLEERAARLEDECACLTETLNTKRSELEEKDNQYETMQEKICALTGELASLKNVSDGAGKRGNSLFAEVDDQRQRMKQLLANQKKHYVQMKKECHDSQEKIVRLKHDNFRLNADMHRELEVCSTKILNARREFETKLNQRIHLLIQDNNLMEEKMRKYEQYLIQTAEEHGVTWLDSMLTYCKFETKTLKDQLYMVSLQKCDSDGQLMRAQEEEAKWRFEALKSRCIIANRESVLQEKGISFDLHPNIHQEIQRIDIPSAKPNILIKHSPYDDQSQRQSADKENVNVRIDIASAKSISPRKILHNSTHHNAISMLISPETAANDQQANIWKQQQQQTTSNTSCSIMEETICCAAASNSVNEPKYGRTFSENPTPAYRKLRITPQRVAQLNRLSAAASKPTPTKQSILMSNGPVCSKGLDAVRKCVNFTDDTKDEQKNAVPPNETDNTTSAEPVKNFKMKTFYVKRKIPTEW